MGWLKTVQVRLAALVVMLGPAVFAPTHLRAQSQGSVDDARIVGTAVIGGKRVELLSDQTWRYSELKDNEAGCVPINKPLQFCGSILDWRPSSTTGTEFLRVFRHDDRTYAGIIYERLGRRDGLKEESYRSVILEGAAQASEVPVSEIPVLEVRNTTVDGVPAETLIFGVAINDLAFVFMNSFIVSETQSFQFSSWSVGKELTEEHETLHANFVSSIRLTLEDEEL